MYIPQLPPETLSSEPSLDELPHTHAESIKRGYAEILAGKGLPVDEVEKSIRWAEDDDA